MLAMHLPSVNEKICTSRFYNCEFSATTIKKKKVVCPYNTILFGNFKMKHMCYKNDRC